MKQFAEHISAAVAILLVGAVVLTALGYVGAWLKDPVTIAEYNAALTRLFAR